MATDPVDGNRIYSKILQSLFLKTENNHSDVVLVAENPDNRFVR